MLSIQKPYLLEKTTRLSALEIGAEGKIETPEGMLLTMTVDGVQMDALPGSYQGDIVLTVTQRIPAPIEGMHPKPGDPPTDYRAVLLLGENGLEDNAVPQAWIGGSCQGSTLTGGKITTTGEAMNGLIITGGTHRVDGLTIQNSGHSPDDGKGLGASILCGGDSETVFENLHIENQGIRNDAIVTGANARITVRDSEIHVKGGTPADIQRLNRLRPGKACMTYVSGGWGTTRAVNVENNSTAVFERCTITSENWGVLSTDGISAPKEWGPVKTRIYAKDCDVAITGRHGYGSYSIGDCNNIFDHTKMYAPDVAYKVANELSGGAFIGGSEIIGGRFGVMWQGNQGGLLRVEDSTIRSGRTTFIARGCYPRIQCEHAVLQPGNRIILQMFDSDDPGFGKPEVAVDTEIPAKDPNHDVTCPQYHPVSIWGFQQEHWCTDLQASFKDMTIIGDFYNGITNAAKPKFPPMAAPKGKPDKKPDAPAPEGKPAGMPPAPGKSYPINMVLEFDHVELEGVISASRAQHSVKTISGENRKEIYQVYDTPCPVVNNGVIVTLKNGSSWTVIGKSYLSALHVDETSEIRTPDGCDVKLVVDGVEIPYKPGDYTGDILVSAYQIETPAMF